MIYCFGTLIIYFMVPKDFCPNKNMLCIRKTLNFMINWSIIESCICGLRKLR